jgi:hypothetical protein
MGLSLFFLFVLFFFLFFLQPLLHRPLQKVMSDLHNKVKKETTIKSMGQRQMELGLILAQGL